MEIFFLASLQLPRKKLGPQDCCKFPLIHIIFTIISIILTLLTYINYKLFNFFNFTQQKRKTKAFLKKKKKIVFLFLCSNHLSHLCLKEFITLTKLLIYFKFCPFRPFHRCYKYKDFVHFVDFIDVSILPRYLKF